MLFVVGGSGKFPSNGTYKANYNASALQTTEFVTAEKSWRGPDLPIPISDACFVKINESMALLLGGISTDGKFPEETFYYDIQERSWIPGINPKEPGLFCQLNTQGVGNPPILGNIV